MLIQIQIKKKSETSNRYEQNRIYLSRYGYKKYSRNSYMGNDKHPHVHIQTPKRIYAYKYMFIHVRSLVKSPSHSFMFMFAEPMGTVHDIKHLA